MDELIPLSGATLGALPNNVRAPRYDRAALSPGIVHIGVGNFHRAHLAWYLHRLFDLGLCQDWAIIGAGVRSYDAVQREKLLQQDCLSTLIELAPTGITAEICGSMVDYLPVEKDNAALIRKMAEPAIRIVSLTVTEGGYYIDPATGAFDESHADIAHDSATPQQPRTAFGAMVEALRIRRKRGLGPFSGLSCDNLQGNGTALRHTVVSLARLSDPDLADWIDAECTFPNSMVDCIVPATGAKEIALARGFGINDAAPVAHEDFRQWVVEDDFCAGRPTLEKVGVTISNDVHGFEALKLRILNGGHQIIAPPGELLGIETIAESISDRALGAFLRKVVVDEIAPHVAPVPGTAPIEYFDLIYRRFANPEIADTTRRVAFDGSSRQSGFIVPSILDGLEKGTSVDGLALVSAIWARYCQGTREDGMTIEPNDPHWCELKATADSARDEPIKWLQMRNYYGSLADQPRFAVAFAGWLHRIYADGLKAAINTYLTR